MSRSKSTSALATVLDLFNRKVVGWSLKPILGHRDLCANDGMNSVETSRRADALLGLEPFRDNVKEHGRGHELQC